MMFMSKELMHLVVFYDKTKYKYQMEYDKYTGDPKLRSNIDVCSSGARFGGVPNYNITSRQVENYC